ncbi:hypothetical protein [Niabella aurantiaca]|uniref:hypothetical protein n=1 Tax=Niabella aurantiaca TaxID=379900 RepID=UPI00038152CB|nr:hypothetical protein [Niabella aurantiaca]
MATVKLDPAGIVTINGRRYPAAKGQVRAYEDATDTGVVFAISALTNFDRYEYTDFIDESGNPFASRQAVIEYINTNFPKASGVTAEQLDAKIQNKTQAEYDGLTTEEKENGTLYLIPIV